MKLTGQCCSDPLFVRKDRVGRELFGHGASYLVKFKKLNVLSVLLSAKKQQLV